MLCCMGWRVVLWCFIPCWIFDLCCDMLYCIRVVCFVVLYCATEEACCATWCGVVEGWHVMLWCVTLPGVAYCVSVWLSSWGGGCTAVFRYLLHEAAYCVVVCCTVRRRCGVVCFAVWEWRVGLSWVCLLPSWRVLLCCGTLGWSIIACCVAQGVACCVAMCYVLRRGVLCCVVFCCQWWRVVL